MLSILIISRSEERLQTLLRSIAAGEASHDIEVLLAWNGRENPPYFGDLESKLKVHTYSLMPYNFAKNNNSLAKYASGDYILFLNDDMILDPGCLRAAIAEIQKPEVGIVGANLRYQNGLVQHAGMFFREDGTPYHRFKHEISSSDPRVGNDEFVPAVTGAFLMMRRSEFVSLKFDERFAVAGEDVALCLAYRAKFKRGILYCADATAIHYENATRRETAERDTPPEDRALIKQYTKHTVDGVPITEVRRPRVRIVTEKPGWIMHRKALEIQQHFGKDYVKINEDWPDAEIHYYINYGFFNKKPAKGLAVGNFTHFDPELHAEKFIESAFVFDHLTSVSGQTTQKLLEIGVPSDKITTIIVGADKSFKFKLLLGVSGRPYKGGRKGEDILKALMDDPEIMDLCTIVSTNPDWGLPLMQCTNPADYYRALDYLLITARLEGGPVPFMEALACGTLSIAPAIGVVPQFPHVAYEVGSVDSLKSVIRQLHSEALLTRGQLAGTMARYNWEGWAVRHEKAFRRLLRSAALS